MKKDYIKLLFGTLIFLFGLALAYFTASYLDRNQNFDYYNTLLIFGGVYLIVGIAVAKIFPVSLGFLFSADILWLHVFWKEYAGYQNIWKTIIVAVILAILYVLAWKKMANAPSPNAKIAARPMTTP